MINKSLEKPQSAHRQNQLDSVKELRFQNKTGNIAGTDLQIPLQMYSSELSHFCSTKLLTSVTSMKSTKR